MAQYTFQRVDTATRARRDELEAQAPGWGGIDTTRPQFAIFDGAKLADWPLEETLADAEKVCAEFNAPDDDDWRSERVWQARMGGDMEAF